MGVYMVNREAVALVPEGAPYGFDDLMRDLLAARRPVHVRPFGGYWLDIGRADDYMQAIDEFASQKQRFING
jgi:NDP-sugar pyrophosphorylase family protein